MVSEADLETAIQRLEELFPTSESKEQLRWEVPIEVMMFLWQMRLEETEQGDGAVTGPIPTLHIPDEDLFRVLVYSRSEELLREGENPFEFRKKLLSALVEVDEWDSVRQKFLEHNSDEFEDHQIGTQDVIDKANPGRWMSGKTGPKFFCELVGLPRAFAGNSADRRKPYFELNPWHPFPPMVDFQEDVAELIRATLDADDADEGEFPKRGLVTLPTGAGKTRVAVESLLRWYIDSDQPPLIIWLCHTKELAEQAAETFSRVWNRLCIEDVTNQNERALRIYRFWSDIKWRIGDEDNVFTDPIDRDKGGVAICTIGTLQSISRKGQEEQTGDGQNAHEIALRTLFEPDCLLIDEAHRFETRGYRVVMRVLGIEVDLTRKETSDIPIIGLTATPWRHNNPAEENRMHRRYGNRFLLPNLINAEEVDSDRVRTELHSIRNDLVERRILSRAEYRPLNLPTELIVRPDDLDDFGGLSEHFINSLVGNTTRNIRIIDDIVELLSGPWNAIIVYSMSKMHAHSIAVALRLRRIRAAAVTGDTPSSQRDSIISGFRAGEIQVLCNHSVLTVGFDAPNTDVIYITRPVYSPIMLEQIVGRGLRGTAFGGTERCLVVTPQERLVIQRAIGPENIVLSEEAIRRILFIDQGEGEE